MVPRRRLQNEFQFHAAEVGRVGREGIFAAKLLAADLPALDPLPDGLRESTCRGALALARTRWLPGLGPGCVSSRSLFHESPSPPAPLPAAGRGGGTVRAF